MRCFALWYGGPGYPTPDPEAGLLEFSSVDRAESEFESRLFNWSGNTPNVTFASKMDLFSEPPKVGNLPFGRIYCGSQGGIKKIRFRAPTRREAVA